jgi:hypothetical protein
MLSVVTLDDNTGTPVTLHLDAPTGKRWLTEAHGLRGVQGLRINHRVKSQAHGGINETRYEDGRQIVLVGEIMSNVSIEDAFAEFALVAAAMVQTLDSAPALLKWTEGATGNALQRLVKLDGDLDPPFTEGQAIISYQAQFFAEDPRAYSQTLQTITSTALSAGAGGHTFPTVYPRTYASSGGGTLGFTNSGNRPTPVICRIYGMAVNPSIVLVGTGYKLTFNGTIAAGDYLEVDSAKRTVKLNGATNRLNFYDGANSSWFDLGAGTSNLQLIAASFDTNAQLTVLGRSAYA